MMGDMIISINKSKNMTLFAAQTYFDIVKNSQYTANVYILMTTAIQMKVVKITTVSRTTIMSR